MGVFSADFYTGQYGGAGEWYLDTANFYRGIRNFVIYLGNSQTFGLTGIHWQVAQATSVENVLFLMGKAATGQTGMFIENGSGGFLGDLTFVDGDMGLSCGNQQFTTKRITFDGCATAINMIWDWGWTFKSITISSCQVGINVTETTGDPGGSVFLLDSTIENTPQGIIMPPGTSGRITNYLQLQNVQTNNVPSIVLQGGSPVLLGSSSMIPVTSWVYGRVYDSLYGPSGFFNYGSAVGDANNIAGGLLDSQGRYFERPRQQYTNLTSNSFISARDLAAGDGKTDDTQALNNIFQIAANHSLVVYIPAGVYLVTNTVFVPPGSRIVGSCWSQIMASGPNFSDMTNPRPMIQVGHPGQIGTVEIQDLLFTVKGGTAGAILVEWNLAAAYPGAAAMWDSHFRVGGAVGSQLSAQNCPISYQVYSVTNTNCTAATLMLHLTNTSSAYIENMWAWVADHDLDNYALPQVNVYGARGILIESQGPSWLYATASEHSVLYQYQLSNAQYIFLGMIQTESPYFSPFPVAPYPFEPSLDYFMDDPDFQGDCNGTSSLTCYNAYALSIKNSSNIIIGGAGLYSWFFLEDQGCTKSQSCQQNLVSTASNTDISIHNLYTVGVTNMITPQYSNMSTVYAKDNLDEVGAPWVSVVSAWIDVQADEEVDVLGCEWDDPSPDCYNAPLCAALSPYSTLDAIEAASSSIPQQCLGQYVSDTLRKIMITAMANYSQINQGYDQDFDYYIQYMQSLIPTVLDSFMSNQTTSGGNSYFDCWLYFEGKNRSTSCFGVLDTWQQNPSSSVSVYYQLKPGMMANLTSALLNEWGVDPTWWVLGEENIPASSSTCSGPPPDANNSTIRDLASEVGRVDVVCREGSQTFYGRPVIAPNIVIPNPKDVIAAVQANITNIENLMFATQWKITTGAWSGSTQDFANSIATPVFMVLQAVDSMAQDKQIGINYHQQQESAFIVEILGIVLGFLPFAGEAFEALAIGAAIGKILTMMSQLGQLGLAIYEVAGDPQDAAVILVGELLNLFDLPVKGPDSFVETASLRAGMSSEDITKLGPVFEQNSLKLDKIFNSCRK